MIYCVLDPLDVLGGDATDDQPHVPLPDTSLSLLGGPSTEIATGEPIHKDVAARWNFIIKEGLASDRKKPLLLKYPSICNVLCAPKLNLEVRGAISEVALRRDDRLSDKQNQISACIAAVGSILSSLLADSPQNNQLIEIASDAGRLLADLQFSESQSRRILVSSGLNKKFQSTIDASTTDEWLFGTDLGERLKSAKVLERSAAELKNKTPTQTKSLNLRCPSNATRKPLKYP